MKKFIIKILTWSFVFLVFWFLISNLIVNWQEVRAFEFSLNWFYLTISFLFLFLSFIILALAWRYILIKLDKEKTLSLKDTFHIYFTSELAKYMPGKVWNILGMVYLGAKKGLNKKDLLVASFLESVLSTVVLLGVGVALTSVLLSQISPWLLVLVLLTIIFGIAVCHPRVFTPLFNLALKILKRPIVLEKSFLKKEYIVKLVLAYLLFSLLLGFGFFFLANGISAVFIPDLLGLSGAFCFSVAFGVVVLLAPGGLGVREGLLVLLLAPFFSLETATLFSLASRVWITIGELLLFAISYLYAKFKE